MCEVACTTVAFPLSVDGILCRKRRAPSITVMMLIAVSALTARRRRGCPRSALLSSVQREVADKGSTPGGVRGGFLCFRVASGWN